MLHRKKLRFITHALVFGCLAAFAACSLADTPASEYERADHGDMEITRDYFYGKIAERTEKYAPQVRTLKNGVKVQRTPNDDASFNNHYYKSDRRGCGACHTDLAEDIDRIDNYQQFGVGGWKHHDMRNELGIELTYNQCSGCHMESHYVTEFSTIIHAAHEDSETFAKLGGNCWSCHFVDETTHEFVLWDAVKYNTLAGISTISDVQGEFSYDQDKLTTDIFNLTHIYSSRDMDRIFSHYAGIDPDPENDGVYDSWTITVDGDVANPMTWTLRELIDEAPIVHDIGAYQCEINGFGGPLMENFKYTGIPVSWLLEQVYPLETANNIIGSVYHGPHSLEYMEEYPAYIIYEINDKPLSYFNGYPAMLYWTDGFSGHDWLQISHISVVSLDEGVTPAIPGHQFYDGTYDNTPNIGFCFLNDGQIISKNEPFTFEGYAHGYQLGIGSVEFSFDHGKTWTKFDTTESDNKKWVYWNFTWTPEDTGAYVISVRTTTKTGMVSRVNEKLINVQ